MKREPVRWPYADWSRWAEPLLWVVAISMTVAYFVLCLWGPLP